MSISKGFLLVLFFISSTWLWATNYGASIYFGYSSFTGPQGERIDGRFSGYAEGRLIGYNRYQLRATVFRKFSELFTKPTFQPTLHLNLSGPYYSSTWRYSWGRSYPLYLSPQESRRLNGSLRIVKPGLPTLSFNYQRYRRDYAGGKRDERDFDMATQLRRGPLEINYGIWRRENIEPKRDIHSLIEGSSYSGHLRFNTLPELQLLLDYLLYRESEKMEISGYFYRNERITAGLRSTFHEGMDGSFTYTIRNLEGELVEGKRRDRNLLLSFWLKPYPDLDLYLSGGKLIKEREEDTSKSDYASFGASGQEEFVDIRQSWRYSLRINRSQGGKESWGQDFYVRWEGGLFMGIDFDTYLSATRQYTSRLTMNSLDFAFRVQAILKERAYVQFRVGRNWSGPKILDLQLVRTSFYLNGSYPLRGIGTYSLDYSATLGKYPAYTISNSFTVSRRKQSLSLNYTRSDVGVYNFLQKGEGLVETYSVSWRTSLKKNIPISLNYTVTKVRGYVRGTFSIKVSWRLR
jgi:hypothetical protein